MATGTTHQPSNREPARNVTMNATDLQTLVATTETAIVTRDKAWGQSQSAELVSVVTEAYVEDQCTVCNAAAEIDSSVVGKLVSRLVYNYSNTNAVANRLRKSGAIPVADGATKSRGGLDLSFIG